MWGDNAASLKSSAPEPLKEIIVVGKKITEDDVLILEQYFSFEAAYGAGYIVECGLTMAALIGVIAGPTVCICCIGCIVCVRRKKRRKQKERNASTKATTTIATPVAVTVEMKTEDEPEDSIKKSPKDEL